MIRVRTTPLKVIHDLFVQHICEETYLHDRDDHPNSILIIFVLMLHHCLHNMCKMLILLYQSKSAPNQSTFNFFPSSRSVSSSHGNKSSCDCSIFWSQKRKILQKQQKSLFTRLVTRKKKRRQQQRM